MSVPGNKNAEKYTPAKILKIVENCIEGLESFKSYEDKQDDVNIKTLVVDGEPKQRLVENTTKRRVIEGYSCLKRALLANKIRNESKLHEWHTTHTNKVNKDKEESIAVSQAIEELLVVGNYMLEINTLEGHYSPSIGKFVCGAILGMSEENPEKDDDDFEGFELVPVSDSDTQ